MQNNTNTTNYYNQPPQTNFIPMPPPPPTSEHSGYIPAPPPPMSISEEFAEDTNQNSPLPPPPKTSPQAPSPPPIQMQPTNQPKVVPVNKNNYDLINLDEKTFMKPKSVPLTQPQKSTPSRGNLPVTFTVTAKTSTKIAIGSGRGNYSNPPRIQQPSSYTRSSSPNTLKNSGSFQPSSNKIEPSSNKIPGNHIVVTSSSSDLIDFSTPSNEISTPKKETEKLSNEKLIILIIQSIFKNLGGSFFVFNENNGIQSCNPHYFKLLVHFFNFTFSKFDLSSLSLSDPPHKIDLSFFDFSIVSNSKKISDFFFIDLKNGSLHPKDQKNKKKIFFIQSKKAFLFTFSINTKKKTPKSKFSWTKKFSPPLLQTQRE